MEHFKSYTGSSELDTKSVLKTSFAERIYVAYCKKFWKENRNNGEIENVTAGGRILTDNKKSSQP
jgi:hypothetical protein